MVTTSQIITIILIFGLYIIIPRTSQVQEKKYVEMIAQYAYYSNGTRIFTPDKPPTNKIHLYENVCNFWKNTKDIYYDNIFVQFIRSDDDIHEVESAMVYLFIGFKIVLLLFFVTVESPKKHENLLVIYIILLLGCVGCNIMALRNPISFNNMILNGAFDIQGSFYNNSNSTFSFVKNFDNQNEFLDLINNGDNIFHFDKCEKINRMDIYNTFYACFLTMAFLYFVVWLYVIWNDKKNQNPENIHLTEKV
jgi:hypothetical protein